MHTRRVDISLFPLIGRLCRRPHPALRATLASDAPRGTSGWRSKHPWGVSSRRSLEGEKEQSLPPLGEGGAQRRMRASAEPTDEGSSAGSRRSPRGKEVSLSADKKESYVTARARQRSRDSARVK
jgi:hypothetical protein